MTSRLRTTFIDNLKSADWMDYETKQSAKEKVPISQNSIPQIHRQSLHYLIINNFKLFLFNLSIEGITRLKKKQKQEISLNWMDFGA